MIIFCEVVVMVWPRHRWLFCCLLDGSGGVYFAAKVMMDQELRESRQAWSGWHINVYLHHG